jgi:hypothetical protein
LPRAVGGAKVEGMSTLLPVLLAVALAHGGGDEDRVRVDATCGGGVRGRLELRAEHGGIDLRFDADRAPRGSAWRITVSQEGSVAWRGRVTARRGAFRVRRTLRDFAGADRIGVRASGPRGLSCRAFATLRGE